MTKLFFREIVKYAIETYIAEVKKRALFDPNAAKDTMNEAYRTSLEDCCKDADEVVDKIAKLEI